MIKFNGNNKSFNKYKKEYHIKENNYFYSNTILSN